MEPDYRPVKVGITLSGGGAKGDFEVGALRFIYDHLLTGAPLGLPPRPDIVTGTSVGAINGAKVAEGAGDSLTELEGLWDELHNNSDMYLTSLDFDTLLAPLGETAQRSILVTMGNMVLSGMMVLSPAVLFTALFSMERLREEAAQILDRLLATRSLYHLGPIKRRIDAFSPFWSMTGPGLRGAGFDVGHDSRGRTVIAARGYDDVCWICVQTSAPTVARPAYTAWISLDHRIDSDPAFMTGADGSIEAVIARWPDDGRYHSVSLIGDPSQRDGWEAHWQSLGYPAERRFGALGTGGERMRWRTRPTFGRGAGQADQYIFARGIDNAPYFKAFDRLSRRWLGWEVMSWPIPIASHVTTIRSRDGWGLAFARRPSNSIVYIATPPGQDFWPQHFPWNQFGGEARSEITVAANGDGRVHVLVVGMDGAVWARAQTAALGNNWGAWQPIGGLAASNIAAARGQNETLTVFIRGLDYAIWHKSAGSSSEDFAVGDTGWVSLGTPANIHFLTDPVVVRRADGMLEVYAVGNDKKLYVNPQGTSNGSMVFLGWQMVGGTIWTGVELRLATVSVENDELRHVDESGRFTESIEPLVGVPAGVLASASIPAIFPAVSMGGQTWVDGGVRSVTPIKAAVDAGAQIVYAVCCSPAVPKSQGHTPLLWRLRDEIRELEGWPHGWAPEITDWSTASVVDIGMRALMEMLITSIQQNELNPSNPWPVPVYVIQPSFDLHDAFTINPSLIRIARSYGWMRAYEATMLNDPLEAMQLSDEIILKRREIWREEQEFAVRRSWATQRGMAPTRDLRQLDEAFTDPQDLRSTLQACDAWAAEAVNTRLPQIRRLKNELAASVARRRTRNFMMPPDADSWSAQWELDVLRRFFPAGPFGAVTIVSRGGAVASRAAGSS
jgi:predicted acylesterase/phospholipase RssA